MAEKREIDKGQRRVYVFPAELVERLNRYQAEVGLASEVETVRRLLDAALKSRDTFEMLVERFKERLKVVADLRDASKEVLIDHPLVMSLRFDEGSVTFTLKSSYEISINRSGHVTVFDENSNVVDYPASSRRPLKGGGRMNEVIDDDIPF